jgi:hypothetical protein
MTAREVYEAVLVEVNKENSATFTIEEFNYVLNKSILAFVNEKYNFFASNQQLSDDLRVLLKPAKFNLENEGDSGIEETFNPVRSYVLEDYDFGDEVIGVSLLTDLEVNSRIKFGNHTQEYRITAVNDSSYPYTISVSPTSGGTGLLTAVPRHTSILVRTAVVDYTQWETSPTTDRVIPVTFPSSDYLHMLSCRVFWSGRKAGDDQDAYLAFPAKRLTYDMLNAIENNVYMRPAPNRPYYQVHDSQFNSGVVKQLAGDLSAYRAYQNRPKIEVHIGRPSTYMKPTQIVINYLKLPELVILDDIDIFTAGADSSQSLELPDYLKNEIVRRAADYLLEKNRDPRISTHPQLNQEIPTVPINIQQQAANDRAKQ